MSRLSKEREAEWLAARDHAKARIGCSVATWSSFEVSLFDAIYNELTAVRVERDALLKAAKRVWEIVDVETGNILAEAIQAAERQEKL